MHWKDLVDERWRGLLLSTGTEAPSRPSLRMQAAGWDLMRVVAGRSPLLWARVAPDHFGYWYVRSDSSERRIVAPIPFGDARGQSSDPGSPEWYRAWAVYFAREVAESAQSPIHRGLMFLGPAFLERASSHDGRLHVPRVAELGSVAALPAHEFCEWDIGDELAPLPLRALSSESSGRVKALRKLAGEDCLPPILVMWMSGLDRYVVLDGHDRLVASLFEGRAPRFLALATAREERAPHDPRKVAALVAELERQAAEPESRRAFSVSQANRLAMNAFDEPLFLTTRAWPLEGGRARWMSEVRRELLCLRERDLGMVA